MKILDNTNNTINSVSQRYIQLSKIKKAFKNSFCMEVNGLEPSTFCLQSRRSPN